MAVNISNSNHTSIVGTTPHLTFLRTMELRYALWYCSKALNWLFLLQLTCAVQFTKLYFRDTFSPCHRLWQMCISCCICVITDSQHVQRFNTAVWNLNVCTKLKSRACVSFDIHVLVKIILALWAADADPLSVTLIRRHSTYTAAEHLCILMLQY